MGEITNLFKTVINKMMEWIDKLFAIFGSYSGQYSKYIIWAVLLFIASRIFKIRLNLGGGRK